MNDSVKELCIGENGKLSAKNLRAFLANNLKNEKLVLRVGAFDSTFENDIDYIVKLIEDNTYYVRNLLKLLVESEILNLIILILYIRQVLLWEQLICA
ncbi:MAG: hypothetical protein V8T08_08735 [Monoglobus pectinilyticus]|uniref:hypothetical protein n=1 Tax=Monoglobus pectinilyticus TaxID=1981510 RepID=UPI00300EAF52